MSVISRRQLLAATGVLVAGGVGAVAAAAAPRSEHRTGSPSTPSPATSTQPTPTQLSVALDRERALITALDAALLADANAHPALANIRADHLAHADAIGAAIALVTGAAPTSAGPASPTTSSAPTVAALSSAEQAAQQAAAQSSAELTGSDAALLAAISACEAGHVELLA